MSAAKRDAMKILLVDDSVTARSMEKRILAGLGLVDIVEAADGAAAVKLASAEKFNLILMDWDMPILSGIEALKQLKANPATKSIPVIMVTAESEKSHIMEAVKLGAADYIIKPYNAETINKKLVQLLIK
jgi:two-component system chemotaxis response regulator CheY